MSIPVQELGEVRLSPTVLVSIFEQYQRRHENCPERMIGAILGNFTLLTQPDHTSRLAAEVRFSFPIPHSEYGNQVSINIEQYKKRMELSRRHHGREVSLLGWFSIQNKNHSEVQGSVDESRKNTEFIEDSFIREVSHFGNPVTIHLSISISDVVEYNTFQSFPSSSEPESHSRDKSKPVPFKLAYSVPELMTSKTYTLYPGLFF